MGETLGFADGKLQIGCTSCGKTNAVPIERVRKGPVCGACNAALAVDRPVELGDATFDGLIGKSPLPVVVDFWAPWCGPCRLMGPVLDVFARTKAGAVIVAKLNTQDHPGTPGKLGIRAIPTLIVFRNGKEARRQVGAASEQALNELMS